MKNLEEFGAICRKVFRMDDKKLLTFQVQWEDKVVVHFKELEKLKKAVVEKDQNSLFYEMVLAFMVAEKSNRKKEGYIYHPDKKHGIECEDNKWELDCQDDVSVRAINHNPPLMEYHNWKTTKPVVQKFLEKHHYDGLVNTSNDVYCSCGNGNIMTCDPKLKKAISNCEAGDLCCDCDNIKRRKEACPCKQTKETE